MPKRTGWRLQGAISSLFLLVSFASAWAEVPAAGEALYRSGVLPSGEPLAGAREGNVRVVGIDAACVSCHRRSGLGTTEGRITVPPIAGAYLFRAADERIDDEAVPYVGTARVKHSAYTDETLARAIRTGVGADGRTLNYLMPRYDLDDATMAVLIRYLKGLAPRSTPGVTDTVLHFATIITPEADPREREGMLAVLRQYFIDKNAAARAVAPRLYANRPMMFRVNRKWQLHVWQLNGPPATWEEQLRKYLAAEPVFAVLSGLGGAEWEPVRHFCESQAVPCLFPNVEAPPGRDDDFYSMYFSRGVLLEAELIGAQLADTAAGSHRVVQLYRAGDVGAKAALQLEAARTGAGEKTVTRVLPAHRSAGDLAALLRDITANDALVLWLRPADLAALQNLPAQAAHVWISGEMGGLEQAPLPASWRSVTRMAYPVDLPGQRVVRVDYALGWFRIRQIPLLSQRVQVDTYLACGLMSETLNHMVEAFMRDYLIERIEMMLAHRALTGYYPRLSLAPGQRFASKGGYVVRFTEPQGPKVAAVTEWLTPEATAPQALSARALSARAP